MAGNRRARVRPGSSRKRSARWSADIAATSATALSVGRCSKRRAGRSSSGWLRVRTAWSKGSAASTRAAAPGSMALSASAMSASGALPSVRAPWTGPRLSSRLASRDAPSSRRRGAIVRDHLRTDDRVAAADRLADVGDPLAAVLVDPRDVGALEQVGEELGELLALLRRPRPPVACQRPLGRLRDVEDLLGDLADRLPAVLGLERGVIEHLGDLVAVLAELVRGRPGPSRRRHPNDQDEPEEDCRHRLHHDREYTTARRAGSRTTSHAAAVIRARAARYTARTPSA